MFGGQLGFFLFFVFFSLCQASKDMLVDLSFFFFFFSQRGLFFSFLSCPHQQHILSFLILEVVVFFMGLYPSVYGDEFLFLFLFLHNGCISLHLFFPQLMLMGFVLFFFYQDDERNKRASLFSFCHGWWCGETEEFDEQHEISMHLQTLIEFRPQLYIIYSFNYGFLATSGFTT